MAIQLCTCDCRGGGVRSAPHALFWNAIGHVLVDYLVSRAVPNCRSDVDELLSIGNTGPNYVRDAH
jgi:hypothetical protein